MDYILKENIHTYEEMTQIPDRVHTNKAKEMKDVFDRLKKFRGLYFDYVNRWEGKPTEKALKKSTAELLKFFEEYKIERESKLTESVKALLLERFNKRGQCYLEITSKGISRNIKRTLNKKALSFLFVENSYPDISGYVIENGLRRLIIAKVSSERIWVRDIYDTKMYAKLLNSKYAFLISTEPLSGEIRIFVKQYPTVVSYSWSRNKIRVVRFDVDRNQLFEEVF